jgi:hypothetical protein
MRYRLNWKAPNALVVAAAIAAFASALGALVGAVDAAALATTSARPQVLPARIDSPARLQIAVAPVAPAATA